MPFEISEWITSEINKRGWSQADLAHRMGFSPGQVSHVITGQRKPSPEFLDALARALKVQPEAVFRAAGLLPPEKQIEVDPRLDKLNAMLSTLSEEEQEEVLDMVEVFIRHKAEKGRRGASTRLAEAE
jgi:transcriptional regulator with XRE-family HTH domain